MTQEIEGVSVSAASEAEAADLCEMLRTYLSELGASPDYPYLALYWGEEGRFPYLIRSGGCNAGFALVRRIEGDVSEIAEFYVMQRWRRRNVGRAAVSFLLAAHPGPWRIRAFPGNDAAGKFWSEVIPASAYRVSDGDGALEFTFQLADCSTKD